MNDLLNRENVLFFEETDSTNRIARELAAQGAPHGTAVIANRQTAGRGRMGKQFHSPEGGLYLSVILRPSLPATDMMAVTACAASAVFSALSEYGIEPQIKWVNDLFLHGRKICGILCEGGFAADGGFEYLIVGIGLNLRPDPQLPAELRGIVTDLATETGLQIDRNDAAMRILSHLEQYVNTLPQRRFLEIYTAHSYTLGKRVIVMLDGLETEGTAVSYTQDAALTVRLDDGTEHVISTGTARFLHDEK